MRFLLDANEQLHKTLASQYPALVAGQLLTPLTRRTLRTESFAVDNSGFTMPQTDGLVALLERNVGVRANCLFVVCPDVVSSARRTAEVFERWYPKLQPWPIALAAQDGVEDLPIPWDLMAAVFIGGSTRWKESQAAGDVVKTGLLMGVHVHVGRVNTPARFKRFDDLGAHTCDGSGVSRYSWMLEKIADADYESRPLFDDGGASCIDVDGETAGV